MEFYRPGSIQILRCDSLILTQKWRAYINDRSLKYSPVRWALNGMPSVFTGTMPKLKLDEHCGFSYSFLGRTKAKGQSCLPWYRSKEEYSIIIIIIKAIHRIPPLYRTESKDWDVQRSGQNICGYQNEMKMTNHPSTFPSTPRNLLPLRCP